MSNCCNKVVVTTQKLVGHVCDAKDKRYVKAGTVRVNRVSYGKNRKVTAKNATLLKPSRTYNDRSQYGRSDVVNVKVVVDKCGNKCTNCKCYCKATPAKAVEPVPEVQQGTPLMQNAIPF